MFVKSKRQEGPAEIGGIEARTSRFSSTRRDAVRIATAVATVIGDESILSPVGEGTRATAVAARVRKNGASLKLSLSLSVSLSLSARLIDLNPPPPAYLRVSPVSSQQPRKGGTTKTSSNSSSQPASLIALPLSLRS